jgi:hypothetical protein
MLTGSAPRRPVDSLAAISLANANLLAPVLAASKLTRLIMFGKSRMISRLHDGMSFAGIGTGRAL